MVYDTTNNLLWINNGSNWTSLGGSGISGSLTAGRIPVADGSTSITDYAGLTYNGTGVAIAAVASDSDSYLDIGGGTGYAGNIFIGTGASDRMAIVARGDVFMLEDITNSIYPWIYTRGDSSTAYTTHSTRNILMESTSDVSGLNLPHGSAPSSPVDGDIWTTSSGLYVQINGSTIGPLS